MRRRLRYGLSALAGVALAAGAVATTATAHPADNSVRSFSVALSQVAGTTPGWATASRAIGTLDASQQLPVQVALPLRDPQGAQLYAQAVADPNSAQFHRYLTPQQFNARFAPSKAQVVKVSSYLKSKGLKVDGSTASNNHFVSATGSAGAVSQAFHTQLKNYQHNGRRVFAPSSAVSLPSSLAAGVTAVLGLTDNVGAHPMNVGRATTSLGSSHTNVPRSTALGRLGTPGAPSALPAAGCDSYFGQSKSNPHRLRTNESDGLCGYTPTQLQSAYGAGTSSAANGKGQTIAIVDAFDPGTAGFNDANTYFGKHGVPALARGQYTHRAQKAAPYDGCDESDWQTEQMLDIEASHSLAPAANLYYYGASNCQHLFDPVNAIVANKSASIISDSWGYNNEDAGAAVIKQANDILIQAAAEGIGVYFSSGDNGDEAAGLPASAATPDFPASSPWVTAVGGTTLAINSTGRRFFETGWETRFDALSGTNWAPFAADQKDFPKGFAGGAGGGVSHLFAEPSWQKNVVPASLSGGHRAVPDVSALADPYTGFLIGLTATDSKGHTGYTEFAEGGTSLACPLIAAMVADAQQLQGNAHFGLLTPALYKAYGTSKLYDVHNVSSAEYLGNVQLTTGQAFTALVDNNIKVSTLQATAGWDNVSGVGSPNGSTFLSGIGK